MELPKKIHKILENKRYFTFLFLENMASCKSLEETYDKSVEQVREYAPKYKPYKNWETFRVTFAKHKDDYGIDWWMHKGSETVPNHIIHAVTVSIDDLYFEYYRKHYNQRKAYAETLKHIQIYFPKFKPYSNFHSFVSAQSSKRKREKKRKLK